ncbi:MAG: alpha/beta fold hydrolase [Chromatiales bacterium]|jgi:pimeloyl-ACP methyl ester carboxylesterase
MHAFFFGEVASQLYGVHHLPKSQQYRDTAVLFCPPLGREYMRTHRGLVRLAQRLAREGYHVLRFDYYATGDSAGEDGDGTIQQWTDDVRTAIQELRDLSGVERIIILGIRMGAALATLAASESPIEGLLLWDPVIAGSTYLSAQHALTLRFHADLNRFPVCRSAEIEDGAEDMCGFRWSQALRDSLAKVELLSLERVRTRRAEVMISGCEQEGRSLHAHFTRIGIPTGLNEVDELTGWNALTGSGEAMMLHNLSQRILQVVEAWQ